MEKLSETFVICKKVFKYLGFWDDKTNRSYTLYSYAMWFTFIYLFDVFQLMFFTTVTDMYSISEGLSIIVCELVLIQKLMTIKRCIPRIEELFSILDSVQFRPKSTDEWKVVESVHNRAMGMSRFLYYCIFTAVLLYVLIPIANHSGELFSPAWYPWDLTSPIKYYATFIYQAIGIYICAATVVAYDSFVFGFLLHTHGQIERLSIRLEKLGYESLAVDPSVKPDKGMIEIEKYSENLAARKGSVYYGEVVRCVLLHKKILDFVEEVQRIFRSAIFNQFVVSAMVICMSLYQLVTITGNPLMHVSRMTYTVALVSELFVYCYAGNEVRHSSKKLSYQAFKSDFLKFDKSTSVVLQIFMIKSYREIIVQAGNVIPVTLSLETFAAIIRLSYSFLALLQSMQP
ncbi:hypothetical protein DMENIID0001_145940 [Sergentomyia squamirostris]